MSSQTTPASRRATSPTLAATCLVCVAAIVNAQPPKPADLGEMPADAHAPLFRPKTPQAGQLTERVAAKLPAAPSTTSAPLPERNFIDTALFAAMRRDQIPHAPLATDQEFLRRAKLDITGRIPSSAEIRTFLADNAPNKRKALTDALVGSPEFVDKWSYFFMDVLRANGKMGRGYVLFHYMLKESLAADRPYDDLARDIISASAKSNFVVAAVNPIVREHVEGKPGEASDGDDRSKVNQMDTHDEVSILFAKIFLGMNISCVSCHNGQGHLEKVNTWLSTKKRSDFFQQSAFFANARYMPHVEHSEAIMGHFMVDDLGPGYDSRSGSMLRMKRSGGPNTPAFLLTGETPAPGKDPREELARMLTAHPQFARATVNMFWAKLMGVGLVEPWDEFDLGKPNQASNPELLDHLATWFRDNNYSVQKLFRLICDSSAYQLSARFPGEWNENYTKYYARKFARMLTAEELHDAIVSSTERPGKFVLQSKKEDGSSDGGAPVSVPMAMQVSLPQPSGDLKSFMAAFGESNRSTPPHALAPSPLQPIMMMRSPVVNDRVLAQKDSRVQRLLDSYPQDTYPQNAKVIDELFLSTIAREPTPAERDLALSAMAKDRVAGAQNLQWALLNVVEFLYNF